MVVRHSDPRSTWSKQSTGAATVLIGAGAGNLPLAQAARALLRGLAAALPMDSTELTEVLVVEQDRLRADQLVRALLAEAGTVPGTVHVTADPALLHAHRPDEHSWTTPHDHLQDQNLETT